MENKRGNVSTVFLVIAIILIVVMGALLYMQKIEADRQIAELKGKIDSISNVINSNKENSIEENNIERLAQNTLDKYINLRIYENSSVGPMPYILVDLGLETRENIEQLCKGVNNSDTYIKSNTNYEKFKEALLQYVTEDYFIEKFSQYRNMDGYVGFCNCAAGIPTSEIESVKLKNKNSENYIFEVTLKDCEMYDHYLDGEQIDEGEWLYNQEVTFKYVNNILVISEIK